MQRLWWIISYAHVSEALIQRKGEEAYAQWDGFAKYNTLFHDNFYLRGEGKRLNTNTAIHVVADLDICYLVKVEDSLGYVAKTMVSQTKIVTRSTQTEDDGGGGSSGGGGGGGQEWSDPVL